MIRGFVAGNLIVGSVMAVATTLVLWGMGIKGAIPLGIASGLLNLLPFLGLIASLALPLAAALCAPSVQHTGSIYCHHSDHSRPACRIRESSYSEIYCQSLEYRAGGGDSWDSLLGLVVGCDGLAAGCAAHGIRQAHRGFASILESLIQHASADSSSDSTLDTLQRSSRLAGRGQRVHSAQIGTALGGSNWSTPYQPEPPSCT